MKKIRNLYVNAYGGLSKPAWMLALVMLINRSGTMVVPFLSIYLTQSLDLSITQAGIIVSCFGIGSMIGALLGGALTDRFGHFIVQFLALTLGGGMFIVMSFVSDYHTFMAGIIILSAIAESLRPANAASVAHYAKPENVSRAFSLNRMAINLGFSVGPAIGGLLAALSYRWLFIADGLTCISAGLFFYLYFKNQKAYKLTKKHDKSGMSVATKSPYRDWRFMTFIALCSGFAVLFFQLFVTIPLYYKDVYLLSENKIGGLLALNGIFVFLIEMVVVYVFGKRFAISKLITAGTILLGFSFVLLNLGHHISILVLAILLISLAEILAMPFMATYIVQQSQDHNRGAYMGLYTLSYSIAHVIAPLAGTRIIEKYGFETLWWLIALAAVVLAAGFSIIARVKPKGTFVPSV